MVKIIKKDLNPDSKETIYLLDLINQAYTARNNAYVPYSNFAVGAAALFVDFSILDLIIDKGNEELYENGKIFTGCNIENASYGNTVCAERTAIFKGVSEGYRSLLKIAICGGPVDIDTLYNNNTDITFPCGICRQVMAEFGNEDTEIILTKDKDSEEIYIYKLSELLPYAFKM